VKRHVWIVEMLNCHYANIPPRWEPTVGCGLTQKDARQEARYWHRRNPFDRFRVRRYDIEEKGNG
jgi:hypothetical protein